MKCAAHTPYFWSHQYRSLRLLGTGLDYRWREYFYSILTIRLFAPQAPRRAWSSSTSAFIQITCLWTTKLDHHTINSSCIIIASSSSHCLLPPFLSKLLDRSFSLQPPLLFCTTAFIATHVDDKELDTTHKKGCGILPWGWLGAPLNQTCNYVTIPKGRKKTSKMARTGTSPKSRTDVLRYFAAFKHFVSHPRMHIPFLPESIFDIYKCWQQAVYQARIQSLWLHQIPPLVRSHPLIVWL